MTDENIQQVTKINPNGTYLLQFPEGTTPEVRQQFDQLLEEAKKSGRSVYLEPGMKVVDIEAVTTKTPEPVVVPEPPKAPEPVPVPVAQPVPQVPQQPAYVIPQEQGFVYDPFNMSGGPVPAQPYQYQAVQQPRYVTPVPQATQAPVPAQAPVYYPGVAPQGYQWVAQPVYNTAPQPAYNPQLAEGPIGQQAPRVVQQPVPQAPRTNATVGHVPYTLQQQGMQPQQ
jgi:hypothetical protein